MDKFTKLEGVAAPLHMINVDTDMIIPKQYLKTIKRTGLGKGLFAELRYDEAGKPHEDFVLHKPPYTQAQILITGENFGCGSSREGAVWALMDHGIRCVIGPSFGDIFFENCFKNGVLALVLPPASAAAIRRQLQERPGAAISVSAYSLTSMVSRLAPFMRKGGSFLSLTYLASERVIPGYGGGMSSAKAALESDTRVLAFEAGRKYGLRVNAISAGPLASRAASAIGIIEKMVEYCAENSPLTEPLQAAEVGNAAAFLSSSLATGITGTVIYVDKGYHSMGMALQDPPPQG